MDIYILQTRKTLEKSSS